jgi:hypothetical protein
MDGPTHRYLGAAAGCWAAYGSLLAGEYGPLGFAASNQTTVDTYAAQHPGVPGPQSSQSVSCHLFSLCLALERGVPAAAATWALKRFVDGHKGRPFAWLTPPPSLGPVTVLDVLAATDRQDYAERADRWAAAVWAAWAPHHATIRAWADAAGY